MRSRWVGLLLCVALLSSCCSWSFSTSAFQWRSDEHYWRIDGANDVVEWIEIEHDLGQPTNDASEQLRKVLAGERVFPPGEWLSFDLEKPVQNIELGGNGNSSAMLHELAASVRVVEAHLVLDTDGRPTLWRRTKFERASKWLEAWQHFVLPMILEEQVNGLIDERSLSPASVALIREATSNGAQLWRLDGNALVYELPMTEADARLALSERGSEPVDPSLRQPAEISFDGQVVRCRWRPDETGWIGARAYYWLGERTGDIPELAPLGDIGIAIEPTESYLALRRAAGLR